MRLRLGQLGEKAGKEEELEGGAGSFATSCQTRPGSSCGRAPVSCERHVSQRHHPQANEGGAGGGGGLVQPLVQPLVQLRGGLVQWR